MQKVLIIVHARAYGNERRLSALRLASALADNEEAHPEVRLFLMSDAVVLGLPNQVVGDGTGSGLQAMVEQLVELGASIKLCRSCALARGITQLPLIAGVSVGTLPELAKWPLAADKVLTF